MNELRALVYELKQHNIAVTEKWGRPRMDDLCFKIVNKMMYRTDRLNNRTSDAGGTLLYIFCNLGQRKCRTLNGPVNGVPFDSSMWCWVTPEFVKMYW